MQDLNKWAKAIAGRITDEWDGHQDFPEDAIMIENILTKLLIQHPEECIKLIGTGVIEEDYFDE